MNDQVDAQALALLDQLMGAASRVSKVMAKTAAPAPDYFVKVADATIPPPPLDPVASLPPEVKNKIGSQQETAAKLFNKKQ